jgi:hypothetical protein
MRQIQPIDHGRKAIDEIDDVVPTKAGLDEPGSPLLFDRCLES